MNILPKEKRISVLIVLNEKIIDNMQHEKYKSEFSDNSINIQKEIYNCLRQMVNHNNLWSFIYVHNNGLVESEINVSIPKYKCHKNYKKTEI